MILKSHLWYCAVSLLIACAQFFFLLLFLSLNQQTGLCTIKSRSGLSDSLYALALPVWFYLSVFWLTRALQLFQFAQPPFWRKKKHLVNAAPYLFRSSNLLWATGVEAEGPALSGDVNLQPFQFHPALQSPSAWTISRPGQRCHLLFISSTIREEKKSIV